MALSEKLYTLRKKSGLSQEQLAEKLEVSRQAISKWESGTSVPESDKLIVISNYFNVSLDYLLKEDAEQSASPEKEDLPKANGRNKWIFGIICSIGGILSMIVWGIVTLLNPDASEKIGESSVVRIDGNGIILILCVAATVFGAFLLLRDTKKK